MPLPGSLTVITVTGTYLNAAGTAQAGTVSFTPTATIMDAAGTTVLTATAITAPLTSGSFSVTLPCTDNAGLVPAGWAYRVTVAVPGAQETFTAYLPHALGPTVDITALAPVAGSPSPSGVLYLPEATVVPVSGPSLGGGFLYPEGDTLFWRPGAGGPVPLGAGAVQLDGTAGDIAALGTQAAGSTGKAADAGHVHPTTGVVLSSSLPLAIASGGTAAASAGAALTSLGAASSAALTSEVARAEAAEALAAQKAANLSDLASPAAARVNLGLTATAIAPLPSGGDDYAVIQPLYSAAMAAGTPFQFGPGKYKFSQPLPPVTVNGWMVLGAGKNGADADKGTLLQALTGASRANWPQGSGIITTTALATTIRDLALDGNGVAFSELAMTHAERTCRHLVSNVSCRNNSVGPGIWNTGCEDVTWHKVELSGSEAPANVGSQSLGAWISTPGGEQNAAGCDFFEPIAINCTDWTHTGGNAGALLCLNPAGDESRHITAIGTWIYDGSGYPGQATVFSPVDAITGAAADAAMSGSSNVLTTTTAYFTSAMVGRAIAVYPPGAAAPLTGTITAFTSSSQVTCSFTNGGSGFTGAFWWAASDGNLCTVTIRACRMVAALSQYWVHGWLPSYNTVTLDDHTVLAATSLNTNNPLIMYRSPSGGGGTDTVFRIGHGGVHINVTGTPHIQIASGGSSTHAYEVLGIIGNYPSTLIGQTNLTVAPSVPASGTALVSPYGCRMYVTISGGTVSAITVNGASQASTSGTFVLEPGAAITLTYSAAPTWTWAQVPADAMATQSALTTETARAEAAEAALLPLSALPLAITSGGSGQATQQAAIDALTGSQSAGKVLRSDGTHAALSPIQAGDLPAATTSAQGAVQLDATASDIQNTGTQAAGNSTKAAAANHVHFSSGMYLATPSVYAPSTPGNFTTSSATLAAVSSSNVNTGSFTAPASGSVVVTASFVMSATAAVVWAFALAAHGTVTPVIGNVVLGEWNSTTANPNLTIPFVVTGLTAGNSYNFDLLFAIAGGSSTLAVRANGQTSTTPTGASLAPNGPVVMIVQAV